MPRLADHLSRVVYSKVGRTAVIVAAELDFRLRRLRHPEISFSDFYTEKIIRTIDSGGVHRTLGKSWLRDGIDAEERERLLQAFRRNGLHTFGLLWTTDWNRNTPVSTTVAGCSGSGGI